MNATNEKLAKTWMDAQEEVRDLPYEEQVQALVVIVWEKRIMNSLGKARTRAKAHMTGKRPKNRGLVRTTFILEDGGVVQPIAVRVAMVLSQKLTEAGYRWDPYCEWVGGVQALVIGADIKTLWPVGSRGAPRARKKKSRR